MYLHSASSRSDSSVPCTSFVKFSNGATLIAEIKKNPIDRARGMQGRTIAVPMLFIQPKTAPWRYHMRNVRMPLDLIEADYSGKILSWTTMQPDCPATYGTTSHAIAIEVAAGWSRANWIKPGDRIRFQ